MVCFVVVFTIFILAICNFDFGFDKVNKNNSNIDSAKSKQSESKSLPTSAERINQIVKVRIKKMTQKMIHM